MWNPFRRTAAVDPTPGTYSALALLPDYDVPDPHLEAVAEPAGPSRFTFRFDREDGHYREITLRAADVHAGRELADRRLGEQFPDQPDYEFASVEVTP